MKLNKNFLLHKTGGEVVVVPTGDANFSGIIRGNESLSIILEYLKNDVTIDEIISGIKENYEDENDMIELDVINAIKRLKSVGAIDD